MPLASGTHLGPYEVLDPLGAGGMGEVFRARDTRLDRTVAIKILSSHVVHTEEMRQRLEREARAISQLNHPHICTLYHIGRHEETDFLVMEYIAGETVADKLKGGPLPLARVYEIGMQIADALERAHRAGIVHRDLKPGNVMLTSSGAKLLDFGLAKAPKAALGTGSTSAPLLSAAVTMSSPSPQLSPLTSAGSIIGTVQYMSPEQIEGKEADARSDIFALGATLYEMVTGKRAFNGKSQLSVATAILEQEPVEPSRVQPKTPPALEHVIKTCLAKDPDDRYQSAADVRLELKWLAQSGAKAIPTRAPKRERLVWAAALLTMILIAATFAWLSRASQDSRKVLHAYLPPPPGGNFVLAEDDTAGPVAISADGTMLAFTIDTDGKRMIWLESLQVGKANPLPGTEGGTYPFWSPDQKWIGFFADGKLKKAPVNGGPVLTLAEALRGRGASWNQYGQILYSPSTQAPIYMVPANGGSPQQVTKFKTGVHTTHRWPLWLPDGKRFLFLATNHSKPEASDVNGIYAASLDGSEPRMVMPSASSFAITEGYVLYAINDTLMALPFDEGRAMVSGDPIALSQNVMVNPGTWRGAFDVSATNVLVFQEGTNAAAQAQLMMFSPGKAETQRIANIDTYHQVRVAPDSSRLAFTVGDPHSVLNIQDLQRGNRTRLTFEGTVDDTFAWSPDGKQLAYAERHAGPLDIYVKDSSGSGQAKLLYASPLDKSVTDWSADGRYILFHGQDKAAEPAKVFLLPLDAPHEPKLLVEASSPFFTHQGVSSPDGRWLAYVSNESGRQEVYLTRFPTPAGKWQVSIAGGMQPRWTHDGKSLLYLAADSRTIMQVAITPHGDSAEIGTAHPYVVVPGMYIWHLGMSYDVLRDGRIVANTRQGGESHQISLILNWQTDLASK